MTLITAIGQATSLEGREAAAQATHQALEHLGKKTVAFGLVIASHHFQFQQILSGITPLLGDTPLLGFSTTAEFSSQGVARRSVVVTLVSGNELQANADWWPGFDLDSDEAAQKMIRELQLEQAEGTLLVAADGLNGDAHQLCAALPAGNYHLAGCLAGGDIRRAQTAQIGGKKAGSGGLAAALLSGDFAIGIGSSHAWQSVGAYFTITGTNGLQVTALDNLPANETYARMFGYTPQDWTVSPLNELARLYPLGLEQDGQSPLLIRSPLRIEADGSLRMNTAIPAGSVGHLMIGGVERCLDSAADAARQALAKMGEARPVLALVLADVSIQMLLEAQPGSELEAVQSVLGSQVPVAGGYTFGQIAQTEAGKPELLNQHITVIVFGEKNL
jgi:hypothetical protein